MVNWQKELNLMRTIYDTTKDASAKEAKRVADEAELSGEDRWLFIERARQLDMARDILAAIGTVTLAVTPYILVKAVTR